MLLRFFGATIGDRVVIRNGITIKHPWHLVVGSDCWIGEQVWIDNLTTVRIGSNVCISQGAYLCTGNHDWADPAFGLRVAGIDLCDGTWAGAKSIIMPGVTLKAGSIAAAGSVVTKSTQENTIVMGNPATFLKRRVFKQPSAPIDPNPTFASPANELHEVIR